MGIQGGHVVGRGQFFYEEPENFDPSTDTVNGPGGAGTAGTMVKATAGGGAKVISTDFSTEQPEDPRRDIQSGLDPFELIRMKRDNTWAIESYAIPSGSAGTVPDHDNLLIQTWGQRVRVAATSVTYSLTNSQLCMLTSLHRLFSRQSPTDPFLAMESMVGCLPNEFTMTWSGGDSPRWTWSGECMRHIATATGTVDATVGPQDNFDVSSGEGAGFEAHTAAGTLGIGGSVIQVGADDNSGAGFELTDVTGDTLTATGESFNVTAGETVAPFAPTPTTAGSVLSHTLGSFTVDGTTFRITDATLSITRNINFIKDEVFTDGLSDAIVGWRDCALNFTIRARRDRIIELAKRKLFANRSVVLTSGTAAGSIITVTASNVRFKVGKMEVPDAPGGGEGTMSIEGMPLDSAEGAGDRVTMALT